MAIRILVIEHPPSVRRTLNARLSVEPDMIIIGETGDVASGISFAQSLRPAVVILDAEMPHLNLQEVVRQLSDRCSSSAVVVLCLHPAALVSTLAWSGATVVGKHEGTAALLAAIRRAAARQLGA